MPNRPIDRDDPPHIPPAVRQFHFLAQLAELRRDPVAELYRQAALEEARRSVVRAPRRDQNGGAL